jgi:hypothetical protein
MMIALNSEQTQVIDQAIQAGLVRDAENAIEVGVATIRRRLESKAAGTKKLTHEEWSEALDAFVANHPTDTPLLSDEAISRDSIYGLRGL